MMRGRTPAPLVLSAEDRNVLERLARRRQVPWFQVQRAKALLAMAQGGRRVTLASGLGCAPSTLWRMVRTYYDHGLAGVLAEGMRSGAPPQISPPPRGPDRRLGMPGTGGQGPAHHPLVQ